MPPVVKIFLISIFMISSLFLYLFALIPGISGVSTKMCKEEVKFSKSFAKVVLLQPKLPNLAMPKKCFMNVTFLIITRLIYEEDQTWFFFVNKGQHSFLLRRPSLFLNISHHPSSFSLQLFLPFINLPFCSTTLYQTKDDHQITTLQKCKYLIFLISLLINYIKYPMAACIFEVFFFSF